ncbi:MAG TPA: type II toxin-antitoxin system VapC family toxin [Geobacterales bacterium]|nr:type II toxin-antitoxin system VapC family toxin [Geobacterales bacterium]
MKFWDTSAIIPLCIDEPMTRLVVPIAREDGVMVVWWGGLVECWSAYARLLREGVVDEMAEEQLRGITATLAVSWIEIEPSDELREIAGRLLRTHQLRAADSLQLAAALVWSGGTPRGHQFVCLDQRLRDAARREGFLLLPERC